MDSPRARARTTRWKAYALAATAVAVTLLAHLILTPWIGDRPVLILFVIPFILSTYVGGLGPGLFATALTALVTAYFVMPPTHSLAFERPVDVAQWMILILAGVLISVLNRELHRARRRQHGGLTDTKHSAMERKVQGGFAVALACLGLIGVISYLSVMRLSETEASVKHTLEVSGRVDELFAKATDAQSGRRGYAVTGDEIYLEPYVHATETVAADVQRLRELTADNAEQQQRLDALAPLIDEQLAFSQQVIDARRMQGFESARSLMLTNTGKQLHDQIRTLADEMKAAEQTLLSERENEARQSAHLAQGVIIAGGVLAFTFVGFSLIAIRRELAGRARAEAELGRFFSLSLDFLGIASADGYFKRVSAAVTDILGWSVQEFLARPFLDFVHPDDHAATLREVEKQMLSGEKVLHFENRYRHKDGSWRVLSWRSMPQPDGLMYATARDVTQLKQAERALQDANEQLEHRVRERTADLEKSTATLELEVAERRQAQDKLQSQLQRLSLLSHITRAIGERQDTRSIFQVVVRTLEGELPLDFACICLCDPHRNELIVTSVGQKSEALAMELAMTEKVPIEVDQNGLSRCIRGHIVYEPDVSRLPFPFPQRLRSRGLQSMVAAPLLVESNVFGVLVAARREAHGFTSGDCEFLKQLSEHVALAAHQAQLQNALQTAYDDLRQSQQIVLQQERLRALGQMASGIAHDINNAISPVSLYTESLLEREPNLSDRARDYLHTIQRAVDDVAQTVSRMREFYRPREPQLVLTQVDLNRLVGQVIDLTRARWRDLPQQNGIVIELQTELYADLPPIMGAESEIRDALTNLIFNAVDAMPQGGTFSLRTHLASAVSPGNEPLRHVVVEVRDTGIGMDEETRRRCLEPFYTTKGERGTGLGLAMVFGMVQRHSADLEIDSAPGAGTTMRLIFPVPAVAPAVVRLPLTPLQVRRLRVLIVDDDPLLIKSLRDILEADGHQVTAAEGGQAAIEAFVAAEHGGEPFAAVITDLGMPYVDGRKVAAAVRAASPTVAIILLTGWGQRLLDDNDIPPGVDRVLAKPPKLHELRGAFAELAGRSLPKPG